MNFKIILTAFIVFAVHGILFDPMYDYYIKYKQYSNLTIEMYACMSRACYDKNEDLDMMLAIGKRETDHTNTMRNGHDSGVWQVNEAHARDMGVPLSYFLNIQKCADKSVSIYQSAKNKAHGDLRKALAYYNAGENYNLKNYSNENWKNYVDYIMNFYSQSKKMTSNKLVIK
jgi:hypothetical protein